MQNDCDALETWDQLEAAPAVTGRNNGNLVMEGFTCLLIR